MLVWTILKLFLIAAGLNPLLISNKLLIYRLSLSATRAARKKNSRNKLLSLLISCTFLFKLLKFFKSSLNCSHRNNRKNWTSRFILLQALEKFLSIFLRHCCSLQVRNNFTCLQQHNQIQDKPLKFENPVHYFFKNCATYVVT